VNASNGAGLGSKYTALARELWPGAAAKLWFASVLLTPSNSKRVLQGEFRFPVFNATPNVSVQIISSTGAAPMQVHALKIQEVPGISGTVETQILVEAETIFDVPTGGIYYANLVVTGVPASPPTKANAAELLD
jgi:hypothetical protein